MPPTRLPDVVGTLIPSPGGLSTDPSGPPMVSKPARPLLILSCAPVFWWDRIHLTQIYQSKTQESHWLSLPLYSMDRKLHPEGDNSTCFRADWTALRKDLRYPKGRWNQALWACKTTWVIMLCLPAGQGPLFWKECLLLSNSADTILCLE